MVGQSYFGQPSRTRAQTIEQVTELAGALQYLHANRVVHGSIRPVCFIFLWDFYLRLQ